ncbi:MAG: hypothetical protein ACRDLV_07775, partial [Solirubrobacteraceae bacterium]
MTRGGVVGLDRPCRDEGSGSQTRRGLARQDADAGRDEAAGPGQGRATRERGRARAESPSAPNRA